MKATHLRFAALSSLALVLATAGIMACANDNTADTAPSRPPNVIPTNDAGMTDDASARADADTDAECTDPTTCGPVVDCTTVDFCGQAFPVSRSITLNAIWGTGPNDFWTVGSRGTVLHGDGTSFTPVQAGPDMFFAIWGTGPNDVWALTGTGPMHSTGFANGTATFETVYGSTFNPKQANTGRLWAGYSASADQVWIGGEATSRFNPGWPPPSFFRLGEDADGGAVWNPTPACTTNAPCTPMVKAFWSPDGTTLWAVGMKGQAFLLDDAAAGHWSFKNPNATEDLEGIWGTGANDIWAVGGHGTIRHWTGNAWDAVTSPTTADLHGIWGTGPNDIWAVGSAGTLVHYDGTEWKLGTVGLLRGDVPTGLIAIWGSGADDVWIVGEGLLLHRTSTSRRNP